MYSPGIDDSELLRRARVDADAFAAFYRRHAHPVYRSLLSGCGDPDVALDLTAETFARALQSIGRFRGVRVASGRAWIFAIANSLLLQYDRERRTEDRARRRLGILEATRTPCEDDSIVARVDAEASHDRLADVLHELPESQQSVLRLRIEDEATYEEIASRLGCSPPPRASRPLADAHPERAVPGGGRVNGAEQLRLAVIERALIGAAERQAQERRRRRRRAIVLLALAAPLMLAVAGSVAATGFFSSVDRHLSTCATTGSRRARRPPGRFSTSPARTTRPEEPGVRGSWQGTA